MDVGGRKRMEQVFEVSDKFVRNEFEHREAMAL